MMTDEEMNQCVKFFGGTEDNLYNLVDKEEDSETIMCGRACTNCGCFVFENNYLDHVKWHEKIKKILFALSYGAQTDYHREIESLF
jgi:hypothetical protein